MRISPIDRKQPNFKAIYRLSFPKGNDNEYIFEAVFQNFFQGLIYNDRISIGPSGMMFRYPGYNCLQEIFIPMRREFSSAWLRERLNITSKSQIFKDYPQHDKFEKISSDTFDFLVFTDRHLKALKKQNGFMGISLSQGKEHAALFDEFLSKYGANWSQEDANIWDLFSMWLVRSKRVEDNVLKGEKIEELKLDSPDELPGKL